MSERPWTPALAIRRHVEYQRALADARRVARALLTFEEREELAERRRTLSESPPAQRHCPWCGVTIDNASRSCSACSDLDRLLFGHVTKRR